MVAVRSNRNAHYALSLGGAGGLQLTQTTDTAATTVLQTVAGKFENGRWYKLRVKIDGTRLQVWIDGQMLFDVSATGGPSNGLAFVAVRGGAASFAHLSVKFAGGTPQFGGVPTAARYWYATGAGEVNLDTSLPSTAGRACGSSRMTPTPASRSTALLFAREKLCADRCGSAEPARA